jgi:hypothetical protein
VRACFNSLTDIALISVADSIALLLQPPLLLEWGAPAGGLPDWQPCGFLVLGAGAAGGWWWCGCCWCC